MTAFDKKLLKYDLDRILSQHDMVLIERDGQFLFRFPDVDAYHIAIQHAPEEPDGSQNS